MRTTVLSCMFSSREKHKRRQTECAVFMRASTKEGIVVNTRTASAEVRSCLRLSVCAYRPGGLHSWHRPASGPDSPRVAIDAFYGLILGLFPINVLHNIVHLVVGVAGVLSASRLAAARAYSRAVAVVFGVLR